MVRVLHVVGTMNLGGIQSFLMNVYRNIDRSKVQFDFLLSTDKECDFNEEIRHLGGKIFSVSSRKEGILKNIRSLNAFFTEHTEYKIVHQHVSSLSNITPLKIARKYQVPVRIVHSHNIQEGGSGIHNYIHKWNQRSVEYFATDYFACSHLAAKWLYPKSQYENQNFKVIRNGIDTDLFIYNKEIRDKYRKMLNMENKFVIGHVGRFHPQKNHEFLINIFKEIHKKNSDSVLLLIGVGDLKSQIERKVTDLGLDESVIFTGGRSDIPELLQAMDVFVFPSLYEGLGIVLIEAQASGLRCFTSDDVVPKDVDVTGLVKFLDLNKTARIWADEILNNKEYSRIITTSNLKASGYDIQQVAEDIQKWYQSKVNTLQL